MAGPEPSQNAGVSVGDTAQPTRGAVLRVTATLCPGSCHMCLICAESRCCAVFQHPVPPGPPSRPGWPCSWFQGPAVLRGLGRVLPASLGAAATATCQAGSCPIPKATPLGWDRRGWGRQQTPAMGCRPWAQGGIPRWPCAGSCSQLTPGFPPGDSGPTKLGASHGGFPGVRVLFCTFPWPRR